MVPHLVLLGDSIFDNGSYVGKGNPSVIHQLQSRVQPLGWRASSVAVDGHIISDIVKQLPRLPQDASHLFISLGGNNALRYMYSLEDSVKSVGEGLIALHKIKTKFEQDYTEMLQQVKALGLPFSTCTIYNPRFDNQQQQLMCETGLSMLNDVILTQAIKLGIPVIDLKTIFNDPKDYANAIEPGVAGGEKIVQNIVYLVERHRFAESICSIYAQRK